MLSFFIGLIIGTILGFSIALWLIRLTFYEMGRNPELFDKITDPLINDVLIKLRNKLETKVNPFI